MIHTNLSAAFFTVNSAAPLLNGDARLAEIVMYRPTKDDAAVVGPNSFVRCPES